MDQINNQQDSSSASPATRAVAFSVHVFTALGAGIALIAMLEAVRALCAERAVACELALESPMACGYGACFGCAVPQPDGSYLRLCVDGPVLRGEQVAEVTHA